MVKKKEFTWWKGLIVLTFLISASCLIILIIPEPLVPLEYEYETLIVTLNDSNDFTKVNGEIIDYICDENVEFTNHGDAYYASTVEIGYSFTYRGFGQCMIKIRREIIK